MLLQTLEAWVVVFVLLKLKIPTQINESKVFLSLNCINLTCADSQMLSYLEARVI